MAKLVIEILCDNESFFDNRIKFYPAPELVTILVRYVATTLSEGKVESPLYDSNGKRIGFAKIEEHQERVSESLCATAL
jgi:hypothetical protein